MALVKKAGQLTLAATPTRRGTISRLSFAVPAGPVYEDAWTSGLSHLLRRVAYRDNFLASGWRSEFDITNAGLFTATELEGWKAGLVGRQFVTYSITGPSETVLQTSVVDKLAQMVFFPRFHPRDVEEVASFLQKDVKKTKVGNPAYYVKEQLFQVAFKGSPHGNSAYMPDYNLKWAGDQQLWDLWEKNFRHDTIKIVGSNVDLDKLNSIIEESQILGDAHVKQSANPLTGKELNSKYVGGHASYIHRREVEFDPDYVNTADSWTGVALKAPSVNNRKEWLAGWIAKGALDGAFGYVDFYGNAPKASAYYDPMDGAGLLSVIFTNYEGEGAAIEKRVEEVKAALTGATESDAKFEAARKSAIVQLSKRLNDSNDSVDEAILSLWTRNEAPTITELVKDLNNISRADFTAQVKKIVESNPTTVFYGGRPLSK